MLDIKRIRTSPEEVKADLRKREKNYDADIDAILALDEKRRVLVGETDEKKARQNAVSKQIPAMKKAGEDTAAVMAEMKALSAAAQKGDRNDRDSANGGQRKRGAYVKRGGVKGGGKNPRNDRRRS